MANDIIKAVKKLGKKLTGQDITGNNLVNVVNDIADNYEGGGGGGIVFVTFDANNKSSMTAGEISEAVKNGSYVIARGSDGTSFYPLSYVTLTSETDYYNAMFSRASSEDDEIPAIDIAYVGNTYDGDTVTWTRVTS